MQKGKRPAFKMRIRVYAGDRMLGPSKMQLLEAIDATGSLSAAAKQMGMSYMRAWTLVQELNRDPRTTHDRNLAGRRGWRHRIGDLVRGKDSRTLPGNGPGRDEGGQRTCFEAGQASEIKRTIYLTKYNEGR
jgi:hypothetical protein